MDSGELEFYRMKAEVLKAMAHPLRLAIVEFLKRRERCVCEIVEHLGAGQPNISRHLALMVRAGVLSNRKEGLNVYYRLQTSCVLNFLGCVDSMIRERVKKTRRLLRKG